ncbi:MAG: GNAT family N-acetyltransferase [Clostridia bacterium]|nr:GNAT family N-acetyltransferase [Clostridia bacterium]
MDFTIGNETDYQYILENDHHLMKRLIKRKLSDGEIIFIHHHSKRVGWLRYGYFWDNIPFINLLHIDEEYRGKGIGKEVMRFFEKMMAEKKFNMIMTSTLADENAQHFYRKCGFKDAGCLLIDNEAAELFMIKNIK